MKFSHTLSINSNPDWDGQYVDYAGLKKVINELSVEKQQCSEASIDQQGRGSGQASSRQSDEHHLQERLRSKFLKKLEAMVAKIRDFYFLQLNAMDTEMKRLKPTLERSYASCDALSSLVGEDDDEAYNGRVERVGEVIPLLQFQQAAFTSKPASTSTLLLSTSHERPPRRLRSRSALADLADEDNSPQGTSMVANSATSRGAGNFTSETIRREICDLFTRYHNLRTYGELNCTAIRKIFKKYDKAMNDNLKGSVYFDNLKSRMPFWKEIAETDEGEGGYKSDDNIQLNMNILTEYFAHFYCQGQIDEALRQLNLMVREFVTFQRRSVWLDVIEDHRKHESMTMTKTTTTVGAITMSAKKKTKDEHITQYLSIDKGDGASISMKSKALSLLDNAFTLITANQAGMVCLIVFLTILNAPITIFEEEEAEIVGIVVATSEEAIVKRNALAIFITASLLWAFEVMPLFVTSMIIPFAGVLMRVIVIDGSRLTASETSSHIFSIMFDHVIMLLIGGFSIAAALSKHNIARVVASAISRRSGNGVCTVLLVNMFLSTFLSMWISNVATPVLCYSLIQPILKASSAEKSRAIFGTNQAQNAEIDRRLCRALVLGIALGSNVGGMASPISSPQNLFAIEYMTLDMGDTDADGSSNGVSWISWFIVSIPLCIVLNMTIWRWLCYCFELPAGVESSAVAWSLQRDMKSGVGNESLTFTQWYVIVVSCTTVVMWCFSGELEPYTGDMGVLALLPFIAFFATHILSKEDLNNFLWSVVLLAMGGLVLGEIVKLSGLLDVIAKSIAELIEENRLSLWVTAMIFTSLILVCTTFISHTVGAIVILPIAHAVGSRMMPHAAKPLVFVGALACSSAMGLPVSGFPNMTAIGIEDKSTGKRYLTTFDFIRYAIPASIFCCFIIATLGYSLIMLTL